jgi:hypothetical protein
MAAERRPAGMVEDAPPARRPGLNPLPAAATPVANPAATEAVVPISIPRGGSREIVLRIVITDGE